MKRARPCRWSAAGRDACAVPDAERPAGERVDRRAVGGAVVGEQTLNPDPVPGEVEQRPGRTRARFAFGAPLGETRGRP